MEAEREDAADAPGPQVEAEEARRNAREAPADGPRTHFVAAVAAPRAPRVVSVEEVAARASARTIRKVKLAVIYSKRLTV